MNLPKQYVISLLSGLLLFAASTESSASHKKEYAPVKFNDIVPNIEIGIDYQRQKSERDALQDAMKAKERIEPFEIIVAALKPRGNPGVIIFDADQDGDEDIYVTNGPGAANSLYVNQLKETNSLTFIDKGLTSGLAAFSQDSAGVCYGDIDNDGDEDVFVQGTCEASQLFENQGDGSFINIDFPKGKQCSSGCSMGDIDNDGLLDIVSANLSTEMTWYPLVFGPFERTAHNSVYKNMGDNKFDDVSKTSGIENTKFVSPEGDPAQFDGNSTVTWAISLVDYDLDGDVDILHTDDQADHPSTSQGGLDRGYIRIFQNDGQGAFTDVTIGNGTDVFGQWMGLSFGDANCDGQMDLFATNGGDYINPLEREFSTRWFFGNGQGGFTDSVDGDKWIPSMFGWGTSTLDYNNDGDLDVVYHGGMDAVFFVEASNSGAILQNQDCSGFMIPDTAAMSATNHQRRVVHGVAVGDLDNNGFTDIVSVSNKDAPEHFPLISYERELGSPFDIAGMFTTFTQFENGDFQWIGEEYSNGSLSVEMNDGANGNNWVKVKLLGSKNIVDTGVVNRDGIGAVVFVTPQKGKTSMKPIVGGASHVSQDSLQTIFGLGKAKRSRVEVLWPGGVRNRFYHVKSNRTLVLPEIPCSYDKEWSSFKEYRYCVKQSLGQLRQADIITKKQKGKIMTSAMRAYYDWRHYK